MPNHFRLVLDCNKKSSTRVQSVGENSISKFAPVLVERLKNPCVDKLVDKSLRRSVSKQLAKIDAPIAGTSEAVNQKSSETYRERAECSSTTAESRTGALGGKKRATKGTEYNSTIDVPPNNACARIEILPLIRAQIILVLMHQ